MSAGRPLQDERVVVVGGGLAGIAAAVRLAEHGVPVTLVETRKRLGGRATSFTDPSTGETLDNCQHVVMRCCTNLLDLYERLGVGDRIAWHRTFYFTDHAGRIDRLEGDDLPAPLHLLRPLLGFKTLSRGEKWAILQGMLAVMQTSRRARERLVDESFAHWLRSHRQPEGAIRKFWSVVITSACNETPDRVAASHALQVFQEGFLYDSTGYEMGLSAAPLVELYDPAEQHIARAGGEVMLGSSAEAFELAGDRVTLLKLADRQELAGQAFISTVPFDRLAKLVTPEMARADARLRSLDRLEVSPIIGIHLFFRSPDGKPLVTLPHLALMESPLQWLFNKGVQRGDDGQATQHLHGVISAAREWVDHPAERITAMAVDAVRRALPEVGAAEVVHARVVKEKRATFSAQPGTEAYRPTTAGPIGNFFLAGDWVATGWPATMEGAVRSGYRAAAAALGRRGVSVDPLPAPDVRPSVLYRMLSG